MNDTLLPATPVNRFAALRERFGWLRRTPAADLALPEAAEDLPAAAQGSALARLGLAFGPLGDPLTLWGLKRWFFPVSRLWAVADAVGRDLERFQAETGIDSRPLAAFTGARLAAQARARAKLDAAEELWDGAFFGGLGMRPDTLAWVEEERKKAAQRWMLTRMGYQPLTVGRRVAPIRWDTPTFGDVNHALGHAMNEPAAAFELRVRPRVEQSPAYSWRVGRSSWLRFRSPWLRLGDSVLARMTEPADAGPDTPTIVFGSGVFVEWDMLSDFSVVERFLAKRGFRVIELVSPFHGRRRRPGYYGGEMFFAAAPLGPVDVFVGQSLETAVLVRFAREAFGGKVAVAGISMGALAAQLSAAYCDRWPADCRPDAALLIAHSGRLESVAFEGSLTRALGLPAAMAAAGWTPPQIDRMRALLNPPDRPAIDPSRIVSLLAQADQVMPVNDGIELGRRWRIPEANVFVVRQSHVSLPLALLHDDAPLRRLRKILAG